MSTTESSSNYDNLESLSVNDILLFMNTEDQQVAPAVKRAIPQVAPFVEDVVERIKGGGRLFYIGAGTSGRLGILDASECPPTFGVSDDIIIGMISGGDRAIRKAVEFAEDDTDQAWKDLSAFNIHSIDTVLGIAASGTTPYVVGGVKDARNAGLLTGCITCNSETPLAKEVDYPIEVIVGPEFLTGSTRLKAGTAQKMVLNMISTSIMIRLGKVKGNKMTHMQLSNQKLIRRAVNILKSELGMKEDDALKELKKRGSVQAVLDSYRLDC